MKHQKPILPKKFQVSTDGYFSYAAKAKNVYLAIDACRVKWYR